MGQKFDASVTIIATGVAIATTGTSASATIPNALSGEKPRYIRIAATAPACVRIGPGATTALTTDAQIQPGDALIMHVPLGYVTIAAIQVAGPGVVQVSPLENM